MRRSIAGVLAVILMIILGGCAGDTAQAIDKRYRDLESYTTQIHLTVTSNKGATEYQLFQAVQRPNQCRTEVLAPDEFKGTTSIVCEEDIHLIGGDAPAVSLKQSRTDEMDVLSVVEFFSAYFDDGWLEESEDTVILHIMREGDNAYRTSQTLELDAKTLLPKVMRVYDKDENKVICAEYMDFVLDAKIESGVFMP